MRAVVQRVSRASVEVAGERVAEMGSGLLALVGVGHDDDLEAVEAMARKLLYLRIFPDAEGRMDCSLLESGGSLGLVSQFTLFGDARKGRRPSYNEAARPEQAEPLLVALAEVIRAEGVVVVTGRFGAEMCVELANEGPVTLLLDTDRRF